MRIPVHAAAASIEERGLLERYRPHDCEAVIAHIVDLVGHDIHSDLKDFYRERIYAIGDFTAYRPVWNAYHKRWTDNYVTELLHRNAIPLLNDGCGNP